MKEMSGHWPPSSTELLALLDIPALAHEQGVTGDVRVFLDEPRFHDRLLRLLAGSATPLSELADARPVNETPVDESDRLVLCADAGQWPELARACGAVCHARSFARVIQASQVEALTGHFGRPLYELAIRHRTLAWQEPVTCDPETLEVSVCTAAGECMAAWFAQLPSPLQAWMRLRGFRDDTPADDGQDPLRVIIVRAVANDYLGKAADTP